MEETVIQEIADQLGMAVDQTGQFIATYLPQYATLRVWSDAFTLFMLLLIPVALGIISAKLYGHHKMLKAEGTWSSFDDYGFYVAAAGAFFAGVFFIAAIALVPNIIGWACFPEAQLIREAMNAIGA